MKGFLRRIHRWPVLMPEKPRGTAANEVSQDTKPIVGRRRGKSFIHPQGAGSKSDRPRSPEVRRGKRASPDIP